MCTLPYFKKGNRLLLLRSLITKPIFTATNKRQYFLSFLPTLTYTKTLIQNFHLGQFSESVLMDFGGDQQKNLDVVVHSCWI